MSASGPSGPLVLINFFEKFHSVRAGLGPNCLQGYHQMTLVGKDLVKEQFELMEGREFL